MQRFTLFKQLESTKFLTIPALPAVIWFICGILCILPQSSSNLKIAMSLLSLVIASITIFICHRPYRRFIWCFLLGILLALVFIKPPWQTLLYHLSQGEGHAIISGTILEVTQTANRTRVKAEVTQIQNDDQEQPKNVSGKIEITSLSFLTHTPKLSPGMSFVAEGAFIQPQTTGRFNYGNYLASQRIFCQFNACRWHEVSPPQGGQKWLSRWFHYKEFLNQRLTHGISHQSYSPILSAMVLGIRSNVSPEIKQDFILAGTIHLLAVSGLHAAAIAWMVMWLLKLFKVPYRSRWGYLIVILGGYVLLTGASPSAVRTWLMIAIFSGYKMAYRYINPIQSVAVAAFLQLCFNPWLIFNSGFQYSYFIVIALLTSFPLIEQCYQVLTEQHLWKPFFLHPPHPFYKRIFTWFMGSSTAWGASVGLTLFYNQLFIPISIFLNLIVLHLAALLLGGGIIKLFLTGIPLLENIINGYLNLLLEIIESLTTIFTQSSTNLFCPSFSLWGVFIYYFLFLCFLISKKRFLYLSLLGIFLFISLIKPQISSPSQEVCTISYGGPLYSPIFFIKEKNRSPVIITTVYNQSLYQVSYFLAEKRWTPQHLFFLQYRRSKKPKENLHLPLGINLKSINSTFIFCQKKEGNSYWDFPELDLTIQENSHGFWEVWYKGNYHRLERCNRQYWQKLNRSSKPDTKNQE